MAQYLHAVGLLRAPSVPGTVSPCGPLLRHRRPLGPVGRRPYPTHPEALNQMNLQVHHVLSDITGVTRAWPFSMRSWPGAGSGRLARHRDRRVKASRRDDRQGPGGATTGQSTYSPYGSPLDSYRHYRRLIDACDAEVQALLTRLRVAIDPALHPLRGPPPPTASRKATRRGFDLRTELYRVLGVSI